MQGRRGYQEKKVTFGTLENRMATRKCGSAQLPRSVASQGFVTAAAPTYLPNDRAFGMKRTRNCDTCFSWYSYIYVYTHGETSKFSPTVLPTVVDLDWFVGRLFSRLSRLVRRGGGHDRAAG